MKIIDYIKEKLLYFIIILISFAVTSAVLYLFQLSFLVIILVLIINLTSVLMFFVKDYLTKAKYYKELYNTLDSLDKKYLITEMINQPDFEEGRILYDILKTVDKSMCDRVAGYKIDNQEYREYIELWVHEIKTPIAAAELIIENNNSDVTESIDEELGKVEGFIEQVLYYSRCSSLEKDYIIKNINIKSIINSVIKRNANALIEKKIRIETNNIDQMVYADSKWMGFIINQIVGNSIKYMDKQPAILNFSIRNENNDVILDIADNGVGISEKSIGKVFDKGYTGENGRKYGKSTGMGLYLCRNLCRKLGLGINIKSEVDKGTTVSILFPHNSYLNIE